jgi:hypothetical protein
LRQPGVEVRPLLPKEPTIDADLPFRDVKVNRRG